MCSGVLSSALWHLHLHGISLHCVHGHGALRWTLDTAAALELHAESPALACASTSSSSPSGADGAAAAALWTLDSARAAAGAAASGADGAAAAALWTLDSARAAAGAAAGATSGAVAAAAGTLGTTAPIELDDDSGALASALAFNLGMFALVSARLAFRLGVFLWYPGL